MTGPPDDLDRVLSFLSAFPLLAGANRASLLALAGCGRMKKVPRGSYLFFQSDPPDAVFLLRSGRVVLFLESADGRELVINEVGPGDCFGELGVVTCEPRTATAEARSDCEVFTIPAAEFLTLLRREPPIGLRLLELTARRLRRSTEREGALAFLDAQRRLAGLLLYLDSLAADKGYLTLSQEDLAQRTGLTRQTVADLLGRWRRRGWLLTGRGYTVLLDRRALGQLQEETGSVEK